MSWIDRRVTHGFKFRKRSQTVVDNAVESYLRDDIDCGSPECPTCPHSRASRLPEGAAHYVIPDATSLIELLEVFELPDVGGIILLTSVVRKVMQRGNVRTSRRLRQLCNDPRRECTVFDNLHHIHTAPTLVERCTGGDLTKAAQWYVSHLGGRVPVIVIKGSLLDEPQTDDTGPQQPAGQWNDTNGDDLLDALLNLGLQDQPVRGCLATPHGSTGPLALSQKTAEVMQPAAYFDRFWRHSESVTGLVESLRLAKQEAHQTAALRADKGYYPAHLSLAAVNAGLEAGSLLQGTIHMSRQGPREAVVQLSSRTGLQQVLVPSKLAINRAVHGDTVAVMVWPKADWVLPTSLAPPADEGIGESTEDDEEAAAGDGAAQPPEKPARLLVSHTPLETGHSQRQPAGEVVGIIQHAAYDVVAAIDVADERLLQEHGPGRRQESVLCVPLDRRLPKLRLRSRELSRLVEQRFVVHMDGWDRASNFPSCHLKRVIGPINDTTSETEAILVKAGIEQRPFSKGAIRELPALAHPQEWGVSPAEVATRRDLRGPEYLICSIDPPGCTDIDDALSVRWLADGQLEVGVHIADVTHFVKQGSLLDGEAYARGTTVYLTDRRVDMLPSLLSEHLCSLQARQDRLAVSVLWTLGAELEVLDVWFGRTIIRSCYQLAYSQAQDILDGGAAAAGEEIPAAQRSDLRSRLQVLERVSAMRRSARLEAGALELESAELRFETSAECRAEVHSKQAVPTMALVAEMMIWANSAVAERTGRAFPGAALLRRHPPPRPEAFQERRKWLAQIAELCERGGAPLDVSTSDVLAHSLEAATRAAPDAGTASLIKSLAARAMSEAAYFSTGDAGPGSGSKGHFGLALDFYTHFTSPIRRYADIVVHRQLLAALQGPTPPPLRHAELTAAAEHMNERNRQAKRAQRECNDLSFLMTMHSAPHVESALVYAIRPGGLLLFVPRFHIRTAVPLLDRDGVVRAILADETEEADDPYAKADRRLLNLKSGEDWARVVHRDTGQLVYSVRCMQRIWVQLSASASRSHGPALRVSLLQSCHPAAIAAESQGGGQLVDSPSGSPAPVSRAPPNTGRSRTQIQPAGSEQSGSADRHPYAQSTPSGSMAAALDDVLEGFKVAAAQPAAETGANALTEGSPAVHASLKSWEPLIASAHSESLPAVHAAVSTAMLNLWHIQAWVSSLKMQALRRLSGNLGPRRQQVLDTVRPKLEVLLAQLEVCK